VNLLRHLEFFVAVADTKRFGDAAAELGMTQPPLSQGVRRLEQHWGAALFRRSPQGVELTDLGQQLLPLARRLVSEAAVLDALAHDLTSDEPPVRVGVCSGLDRLGPMVVASAARTSGRRVQPLDAGSVELVDRVRRGLLDVAVVRHPAIIDGTDAGDVLRVRQWLLVPKGVPDSLDWLGLPVVCPPRSHHPAVHDQLVDALRRHGHSGETTAEVSSDAADCLVAAGQACRLPAVDIAPAGARVVDPPRDLATLRLRVLTPSAGRGGSGTASLRAAVEGALA
jgi:DNA-binding transcriptional LysR family regulator